MPPRSPLESSASDRAKDPAPEHKPLRRWFVGLCFVALLLFTTYQGRAAAKGGSSRRADRAGALSFREVSRDVGIRFEHAPTSVDPKVKNLEPHITAVGAAVSVADVDGDGRPELYATTSAHGKPNALFRDRGDGTFEDVAAQAGLADLNRDGEGCSMGSVWADYDGDGLEDVFVYQWGHSRLFHNEGGLRFRDATKGSGLERWMNSNAATWIDYDLDGNLDLYVTGYFAEEHNLWKLSTTRIMHESFEFARNGGNNYLYRGRGDGTFEDVTESTGANSTRWTYAAVAADFDRDGWPDLYLANDYGPEELLLNREGRRFELAADIGLEAESKSGMCVALGDVRNEGRLSVFVSNISQPGYLFQGNNLRISFLDRKGPMSQFAEGEVANCGWAWGAQFGDLDDDGLQDLVVVNGFISASRERDYWYQMSKIGLGAGGIVADAAEWPPIEDRSLSGYERTRVLRNLGTRNARFSEVGVEAGIVDEHDGRAVAFVDLFDDGALDVVVANQKGPLLVYRNETKNDHHWIGFRLKGSAPNTSAIGAEVELEFSGARQIQVVTSACGFSSQNDRRIRFGLGATPGEVRAHIRWPKGKQETLERLELDRYHVIEESTTP
jgi:hypothetical protein